MQKEAAVLAEQGKKEEAERLLAKLQELLQQARKRGQTEPGPRPERPIARLSQILEGLRAKERQLKEAKAPEKELVEVRDQIARTEHELQRLRGRPGERQTHEEAINRIRHLRVAAENLKAAGAHDLAVQLMRQAEEMERDVQAARERERPSRPEGLIEQVQALRREVEQLRAQVEELKKQRKRP
jgi:prefoldin subunit 5